MRRMIGVEQVEDIALGAAVLGTGGGGDPYIGKLMATEAIREYGLVELVTIDEVGDDEMATNARRRSALLRASWAKPSSMSIPLKRAGSTPRSRSRWRRGCGCR